MGVSPSGAETHGSISEKSQAQASKVHNLMRESPTIPMNTLLGLGREDVGERIVARAYGRGHMGEGIWDRGYGRGYVVDVIWERG